jgi:hypothetical protein
VVSPAPTKWVVPGRQKAWEDPTLSAPVLRPKTDRRLLLTLALAGVAVLLAALVLRLSRPEDPGPGPGLRPVAAPAPVFDDGIYDSENVHMKVKAPPPASDAPQKEESP